MSHESCGASERELVRCKTCGFLMRCKVCGHKASVFNGDECGFCVSARRKAPTTATGNYSAQVSR